MGTPVTIGLATLYLADARDVSLVFDGPACVITDPVWPNCPAGMLPGADGRQADLLHDCLVNLHADTVVVVLGFDSDPRFLSAVPARWPFIRSQVLPYAFPGYKGRLLRGDEMAFAFGQIPAGPGVIPGRAVTVTSHKADRLSGHPCPRAVDHMKSLVRWWSVDTVFDPFMGIGSIGVAAVQEGRKYVGIEIDPNYFDLACREIEAAQSQRRLFA